MKKRPPLDRKIKVKDFKNFYWLKEELIAFCRATKISPSGGKIEITARIEHFLNTGEHSISIKKAEGELETSTKKKKSTSSFDWKTEPLSRKTVITDNYKNGQNVRHFFYRRDWKKVFIQHPLHEVDERKRR